jgi:UDP-2,3-diacylglucosamine pyrophosphatase LpxH
MKVKTLFISDVHLGTKKCQADKLLEVMKKFDFDEMIIIGDLIDLTSLKRKFYWNQDHSTVIQKILKESRKGKRIVYILGNHDYYLRSLIEEENINIGNVILCDEWYHTTLKGEKIYLCHGDQFDGFIRLHPFIYSIGDWAYEVSFKINRFYNKIRKIFGLEYWSFSQYLKYKVKNAVMYINNFKLMSLKKLKETNCDSIMIGHIHTPAIENIGENTYYNTGDFCETCSFLYEDLNGEIKLVIDSLKD